MWVSGINVGKSTHITLRMRRGRSVEVVCDNTQRHFASVAQVSRLCTSFSAPIPAASFLVHGEPSVTSTSGSEVGGNLAVLGPDERANPPPPAP